MLLAAAGAVLLVRGRTGGRRPPVWLWVVPVLLLLGVTPLLGAPRYRVPLDPFLAILAGVALSAAAQRIGARGACTSRTAASS